MIINDERVRTYLEVDGLTHGDVFEYNGIVYMKTLTILSKYDLYFNCVRLDNGMNDYVGGDEIVELLFTKITICNDEKIMEL